MIYAILLFTCLLLLAVFIIWIDLEKEQNVSKIYMTMTNNYKRFFTHYYQNEFTKELFKLTNKLPKFLFLIHLIPVNNTTLSLSLMTNIKRYYDILDETEHITLHSSSIGSFMHKDNDKQRVIDKVAKDFSEQFSDKKYIINNILSTIDHSELLEIASSDSNNNIMIMIYQMPNILEIQELKINTLYMNFRIKNKELECTYCFLNFSVQC